MADFGGARAPDDETWAERRARIARDVLRRSVAHAAAGGTTDMAPGPMVNLAQVYTDPVRHEAERQALFLKLPLLACLSSDMPNVGDARLFEEAGPSILLVRSKSGEVNAFLNMCTHRGAKLVREPCNRKLFTCPFHAWGFDTEGKLAVLPGERGFEGLDKAARGLVRVPVGEWAGMIFVKAHPGDERIDVERWLGDFAPELAQLQLHETEPVRSSLMETKANWKFALDTYGEGYHFSTLHASSIGQTHYTDVAVYDRFGPHHRISFPDKGVLALVGKPESEWPETEYGGVHYLFPNTVLFIGSITPGRVFTQIFRHFQGETPGEMKTYFSVYAPHGVRDDAYQAEVEMAHDGTRVVVTTEDYVVAAEGWANMAYAPESFSVVYGANEVALQNQHRAIAEACGMPLPEVSL
jgi:phenylpropionate dioxygenase-like ring-hydroxylating dioxygenase large terminal subunit